MMDLARHRLKSRLDVTLQQNPLVVLIGPRQTGKTSLALDLADQTPSTYFDLENPTDARRLENPINVLGSMTGLLIFDHVQAADSLLQSLCTLAERSPCPCRFLILGNQSPLWLKTISKDHLPCIFMGGFLAQEIGVDRWKRLWLRGGFPSAFLADSEAASSRWRLDFIRTILERNLHLDGVQVGPQVLRRLLQMLAHQHGQVVNTSELGRSLGEAHTTIKRHIEILGDALLIRSLQPWQENISKRQIKFPKLYIRDSGLAHALLNLASNTDLEGHPVLAASWEGYCIEHILAWTETREAWFWGTHGQAELDLLIIHEGRRFGFEFKFSDAPGMTRAMHIAHEDLHLEKLFVVYPGAGDSGSYRLSDWAEVVVFKELEEKIKAAIAMPVQAIAWEVKPKADLEPISKSVPEPTLASGRSKMGFAKFFGP